KESFRFINNKKALVRNAPELEPY
ncbi:MAG: hypothetical protein K0Q73_2193, partial [Paenibacillus sp.]|nr:hypothetical protein [Paenibacillus sp.]